MLRAKAIQLFSSCGIVQLAVIATACGTSPLSPTPVVPPVTVTLSVVARDATTGALLPDVRAFIHNGPSCITKDDGRCTMDVLTGSIVTVAAWGTDYAGRQRTEQVSQSATWTFYLVRE